MCGRDVGEMKLGMPGLEIMPGAVDMYRLSAQDDVSWIILIPGNSPMPSNKNIPTLVFFFFFPVFCSLVF